MSLRKYINFTLNSNNFSTIFKKSGTHVLFSAPFALTSQRKSKALPN